MLGGLLLKPLRRIAAGAAVVAAAGQGGEGGVGAVRRRGLPALPGGNCIKMDLPGKSILRDYHQENRSS